MAGNQNALARGMQMKFLDEYIEQWAQDGDISKATYFRTMRNDYLGSSEENLEALVNGYNDLSRQETKDRLGLSQNIQRNVTGAVLQDYLKLIMESVMELHPDVDLFEEVPVSFGSFYLWKDYIAKLSTPTDKPDLCIGLRSKQGVIIQVDNQQPKQAIRSLETGENVVPIILISSKIRVSQGEFFDWFGRKQLTSRGHPHCLSVQVALRTEMNLEVVQAAQANDSFFVLGGAYREGRVEANADELNRFIGVMQRHLESTVMTRK